MRTEFQFDKMGGLELDGGNGCVSRTCLVPLNCHLNVMKTVKILCSVCFTTMKK